MSDSDISTEFPEHSIPLLTPESKRINKRVVRKCLVCLIVTLILSCLTGVIIFVAKINAEVTEATEAFKKGLLHVNSSDQQLEISWPLRIRNLSITRNLIFSLQNGGIIQQTWRHSLQELHGEEPSYCSSVNTSDLCIEWRNGRRLEISVNPKKTNDDNDFSCYIVEWSELKYAKKILTDCFDVTKSHWYGGFENHFQYWPLERNKVPFSPYVSNDASSYAIGNVLERYFISSSGVGLYIDNDVPLYFSLNEPKNGSMCFSAQYKRYPYLNNNSTDLKLSYKVCHSGNIKNAKDIHEKMFGTFFQPPGGIPHEDLFKFPIWSTWAQFHPHISESIVLQFTKDIVEHGFSCSQIEIDDRWTPHYGDMFFDVERFPNAYSMIQEIKKLCGAVTVWVHPFFNVDGKFFLEAKIKKYLLRQVDLMAPALIPWWDGFKAGVLDVSNKRAVSWYLDKLKQLQTETKVDSFKFDAGELSWIPKMYDATDLPPNPGDNYPARYVDMAARADVNNRQEVRCAYRTQKYPIFVRQIDKSSKWGHDNGLKSIIPGVFTFGILGYPFVLPDMIGGNDYGSFPDSELFVRWIQLNSFLPGMQLSILPWDKKFNDSSIDVVSISRKFTKLRAEVSEVLIKFAKHSVKTGEPIIRPLWWIDPSNEVSLKCEDEYLVGDYYLVAPILIKGARSRDIFVPSGRWRDMLRGNGTSVIKGPCWLHNYEVKIDELAYFQNVNYKS